MHRIADDCATERSPHPEWLIVVEVAAPTAWNTFSRLPKSVNLGIINVLKPLAPHKSRIAQPDQNDESGAPVSVGQTFELLGEADAGVELGAQIGDRHGDLGGHRIAPAMDRILRQTSIP